MEDRVIIKKSRIQGHGLFALRDIEEGEHILRIDLRGLRRMSVEEIDSAPGIDGDHSDYAGWGRYVVDHSPGSYINHSCDPNCYVKMRSIRVKDVYALRGIRRGEELTTDYTATSVDQFTRDNDWWAMDCNCGSENCRGRITGDFFRMPRDWQESHWPHLAPSVKRKYRERDRRQS